MSTLDNIVINVFSNCVFVILISCVLGVLYLLSKYGRLGKARQFFGLHQQEKIRIYVPGFEHPKMRTKRVVTALEYESAVEVKRGLERMSGSGPLSRLMTFFAGVIGQEINFPVPDIEVSPLYEVKEMPTQDSVILIGGPVTNQLSKFCLRGTPQIKFNEERQLYQKRIDGEYKDIVPPGDTAIVEKRIIEDQVIFLVHGYGEEQTRRASQYLIYHWMTLHQKYKKKEFGILV